jgi:hypothetical protein
MLDDEPKDPNEMTTDEAAEYLFPPEVVEHLKSAAHENDEESDGDDDS